jgi:mRNA deadenylase 3'-5' endonuclease subunit Ccr4
MIETKLRQKMKGHFRAAHPSRFTCYSDKQQCLDYIMFTHAHFKVISTNDPPPNHRLQPSIPNAEFPSDHLPLETVLELLN